MLTYEFFKMVHVLGIVIFLGNIIVTGVWKYRADATSRPEVIAFAQRLVTLTDWIFTFGGVILILIGGFGMAHVAENRYCADAMDSARTDLLRAFRADLGSDPDPDPGHAGPAGSGLRGRRRNSRAILAAEPAMVHLGHRRDRAAAAQHLRDGAESLIGAALE